MGQSLVKNYMHIVFGTKLRRPMIRPSIEKELYGYLGSACRGMGCPPIIVGGYWDHVHILCLLSKNIALAELVKILKVNSSKWMKSRGEEYPNFYWQDGYGAFSVNPRGVEVVVNYIRRQKEHHSKRNFQNKYLLMLKKYDVEYDERYLWR